MLGDFTFQEKMLSTDEPNIPYHLYAIPDHFETYQWYNTFYGIADVNFSTWVG